MVRGVWSFDSSFAPRPRDSAASGAFRPADSRPHRPGELRPFDQATAPSDDGNTPDLVEARPVRQPVVESRGSVGVRRGRSFGVAGRMREGSNRRPPNGVFAAGDPPRTRGTLYGPGVRRVDGGPPSRGLGSSSEFVDRLLETGSKVEASRSQEFCSMRLNWFRELGGIGQLGGLGRLIARDRLSGVSRPLSPSEAREGGPSAFGVDSDNEADLAADADAAIPIEAGMPRIVRQGIESSPRRARGPVEGFIVRPILISKGPASNRVRDQAAAADRVEMGPRRLVP